MVARMSKKNETCKFSMRSFSETKVQCMNNYSKLLRESAGHFIIHVRTQDVSDQNKSSKWITESIVNLSGHIKNKSHDINIMCIPAFLLENRVRGFEPPTKFSKRGAWQDLNYSRGTAVPRGGDFFQVGLQFLCKK